MTILSRRSSALFALKHAAGWRSRIDETAQRSSREPRRIRREQQKQDRVTRWLFFSLGLSAIGCWIAVFTQIISWGVRAWEDRINEEAY